MLMNGRLLKRAKEDSRKKNFEYILTLKNSDDKYYFDGLNINHNELLFHEKSLTLHQNIPNNHVYYPPRY